MAGTYKTKLKITKKEQEELFIKFAKAIASLRGPEEVAYFLRDLLSEAEVLMLARRLQIAELITEGFTYEQIREHLKVGDGTIARVQTWLETYGDGYRTVLKRIENDKSDDKIPTSYDMLKKRYPIYHWPELLLAEIVKSANKREKQKLLKIVDQLKDKTKLSKDLKKILNS